MDDVVFAQPATVTQKQDTSTKHRMISGVDPEDATVATRIGVTGLESL